MITKDQMPEKYKEIIDEQIDLFGESPLITVQNSIPDTTKIPIENPRNWLRIPDVICVFVDMKGSTLLSAQTYDKSTANIYQLFTATAVQLFDAFESPYIDVRGDGVLALFNSNQPYRAIASAVTFKTFVRDEFTPRVGEKTELQVGGHIGIDQKTVLVRKIGLKRYADRTDRQNEVWAGKPVNMAAKLASIADVDQLIVSERFYKRITDDLVRKSCGCPDGEKRNLWSHIDLSDDDKFDFDDVYLLKSYWCPKHGKEYCNAVLDLDE